MQQRLTITRPDDWHLHLRDGDLMRAVLPDTAHQFARAIVMPNLRPPVTTTEQAVAYRERPTHREALKPGSHAARHAHDTPKHNAQALWDYLLAHGDSL